MMKKNYSRMQRVSNLIQTTLAEILRRNSEDLQVGMVTVTSVKVSHDLSHAKIYVSILEDEKAADTILTLNNATKALRYELANAIDLRITPELKFFYDDSAVRGSRISSLINQVLKDNKSSHDD